MYFRDYNIEDAPSTRAVILSIAHNMGEISALRQWIFSIHRPNVAARYFVLFVISLLVLFQLSLYTSHSSIPQSLIAKSTFNGSPSDTNQEHLPGKHYEDTSTGGIPTSPSIDTVDGLLYSNHQDDALASELTSKIGKVTSIWYETVTRTTQAYEHALQSHKQHDVLFGYKHFVQRRGAIEKLWSKHAYLIHILVQELNKPVAERLEWLFWHDADVILLNSLMPLEVFLPPDGDRWAHINLLITNDQGGLNDGTFFVRVCEWSIYFFAAGLSFPFYRPNVHLRFDEQTALGFLLDEQKYKNNTLHMPQKWFNAYHHWGQDATIPPEWNFTYQENAPGDLLVHLPGAGDNRVGIIKEYVDKVSMTGNEKDKWNVEFNETMYPRAIGEWWEHEAERENERQDAYWRRYHILSEVGPTLDREKDEAVEKIKSELAEMESTTEEIEAAVARYEKKWKLRKMEAFRDEEALRKNGTHTDNVKVA